MSRAYMLGRLLAAQRLEKSAGPAKLIGAGLDQAIGALGPLLSGAGKLYGSAAKAKPLTTAAGTIPALGLGMEGLSALGQYSGLSGPSSQSWYAPHLSALRFDPRVAGWKALINAVSQPGQFVKHLVTGSNLPEGVQRMEGYNPTTGKIQNPGSISQKVDPWTGKLTVTSTHNEDQGVADPIRALRERYLQLTRQFGVSPEAPKLPAPVPAKPEVTPAAPSKEPPVAPKNLPNVLKPKPDQLARYM